MSVARTGDGVVRPPLLPLVSLELLLGIILELVLMLQVVEDLQNVNDNSGQSMPDKEDVPYSRI